MFQEKKKESGLIHFHPSSPNCYAKLQHKRQQRSSTWYSFVDGAEPKAKSQSQHTRSTHSCLLARSLACSVIGVMNSFLRIYKLFAFKIAFFFLLLLLIMHLTITPPIQHQSISISETKERSLEWNSKIYSKALFILKIYWKFFFSFYSVIFFLLNIRCLPASLVVCVCICRAFIN